jgi:hypothetical protein
LDIESARLNMIEYKFKEKSEIVLHYAKQLNDQAALKILTQSGINSPDDVKIIAKFYWSMVDLNVKEIESGTEPYTDMEKWLERIYTSLHIHFNNIGYGDVWDNEIPE